jgi:hypothetical protein
MKTGDSLGRRVLRRLLAAVLAVLVGMADALALYYTSLQPGERLVASVFTQNHLVKPPADFSQIAPTVTERRVTIPVPDAPRSAASWPPCRPMPPWRARWDLPPRCRPTRCAASCCSAASTT